MEKNEFLKNYQVKPEENGFYHILFTSIVKEGKRTRDVHRVTLYSPKEHAAFKKHVSNFGLNCIGNVDSFEIVHDPTKTPKQKEVLTHEDKPKGRPSVKKEE